MRKSIDHINLLFQMNYEPNSIAHGIEVKIKLDYVSR